MVGTYKTGPKIPRNAPFEKIPIPPKKINKARELHDRVIFAERRIDSFEVERRPPRAIQSQPTFPQGNEEHNASAPASGTSEDISGGAPEFPPKSNTIYRGRRQGPLGPYERAHALLIRHLGACPRCRRKKVQCSLDHHDLSSLRNTNLPAPSTSSASSSSDNTGITADIARSDDLSKENETNQNVGRHRSSGRNPSMADLLIPQDSVTPTQNKISGANFPYETTLFKSLILGEKGRGKKHPGRDSSTIRDDAWARRPLSGEALLSGKVVSPRKIVDDASAKDSSREHDISKGPTGPNDGIIITDPEKMLSQQDWLNRAVSRSLEESKNRGNKKEEGEFIIKPNDPMEIMRRRFLKDDFRRQQSAQAAKAQEEYNIKVIGYNIVSPISGQFPSVQQSYRQSLPSSPSASESVACGNVQKNGQQAGGDSAPEEGNMPKSGPPNATTARLREIWTNAEEITHPAQEDLGRQSFIKTDTRPPPSWAALNHPIQSPIAPVPRIKSADGTAFERPRKKVKYISGEPDRSGRHVGVNGSEIPAQSYLITHYRAQSTLPASASTVPDDFLFGSKGSPTPNGNESSDRSIRVVGTGSKSKGASKKREAEDLGPEGDAKRSRVSSSDGFASEYDRKEDCGSTKNYHGRDDVMVYEPSRFSDEFPPPPQPISARSPPTEDYICKYCDIEFPRYQDLKNHLQLHDLSEPMDIDVEELVVEVNKARDSHYDELPRNEEVYEDGDVNSTSSDALDTEPIFKRLYRVLKNKVWGD